MIRYVLELTWALAMEPQIIHLLKSKVIISLPICTRIDKIKQFLSRSTTFSKKFQDLYVSQLAILLNLFSDILCYSEHGYCSL